jgi:hypothetical protein
VKDRRGPIGRATEIAESVVAGVKRRQAARAPKVLLYDEAGRPRMVDPSSDAGALLVETARAMLELTGPDEAPAAEVPEEE